MIEISRNAKGQYSKGIHPPTQFKAGKPPAPHKVGCHCLRCAPKYGADHPNWRGGFRSGDYNQYMVVAVNKRRALKRSNGGSHTAEEWHDLKVQFNYMCLCCKRQEPLVKLTEDHITPLAMGGRNDISNIQPLCRSCNAQKHIKAINYIHLYERHN